MHNIEVDTTHAYYVATTTGTWTLAHNGCTWDESAARRESLSPMLGGYPSTPSSRRRMSRSANLGVGSPVVYYGDGPFLMRSWILSS